MTVESPSPTQSVETHLFDTIALSMSGGGFRAAAYSLGTLNMLHLLGVLPNVQMLSTISGGTITGAFYATARKQGRPFPEIYDELYKILSNDAVLPESLKHWKKSIGHSGQNYKLIRAFADTYDTLLYNKQRLGIFWEPDDIVRNSDIPHPLQTVVFGATELYSGLAFRFQYAQLPDQFSDENNNLLDSYKIGNGNIYIRRERAKELRIADIVAASSCLPFGFEPLVLPDDFPTENDTSIMFLGGNDDVMKVSRLALVDGGVYDNQGIDGLLKANDRNLSYIKSPQAKNALPDSLPKAATLFLIADVASAEKEIYNAPEPGPARGRDKSFADWAGKLKTLKWSLVIALVVFGFWQLCARGGGNFMIGVLAGLSIAGLIGVLVVSFIGNKLVSTFERSFPEMYRLALPSLAHLSPGQLFYIMKIRFTSLGSLLWAAFLRRARSLNYGLLYNDDMNPNRPQFTVMPSIIGGLLKDYENPWLRSQLKPVIEIIRTASEMGTTLWWLQDKSRMDKIICAAEITLLWRILRYFERIRRSNEKFIKNKMPDKVVVISDRDEKIEARAKELWKHYVTSQTPLPPTF